MAAKAACGGDLELAGWMLACFRELGTRAFQALRHLARGAPEQFALLGENEAARVPVEQRRTQFALQRADLAADGRLAQPQTVSGLGEASRFSNRVEDSDAVPIHRFPPVLCVQRMMGG